MVIIIIMSSTSVKNVWLTRHNFSLESALKLGIGVNITALEKCITIL